MHVEDGSLPFQSFHLFNSAVKKWYDYTNCSHTLYRLSSQYLIPQESVTQNQDSHNRKQKMYTCKLVLSLYRAGINNYYCKCSFYSHIFQDFHIIVGWGPPCDQSWTPFVIFFLKHLLHHGKRKSQIKFWHGLLN